MDRIQAEILWSNARLLYEREVLANLKEEERSTYFLFSLPPKPHCTQLAFCSTTSEALTNRVEVSTKNILYTNLLISDGG